MTMNFKKGLVSAAVISLGLLSAGARVLPASASTGSYLIKGGTVVNVQNTSSNGDNYAIFVTGGTGICSNNYIIFPKTGVINKDVHDRGYQAALSALTNNLKIDVFDYAGASCAHGGQVSIYK
jgi:hypothetical protein